MRVKSESVGLVNKREKGQGLDDESCMDALVYQGCR